VASGPLLAKFSTLAQTFSYATDNSYVKIEMQERRTFWHFRMSSENISFLMIKLDMYSKTRTYGCLTMDVTSLDGARDEKQVWRPHVRTWSGSKTNVLYWRKYLWHCWDYSAPPPRRFIVIRRPGNCACISGSKTFVMCGSIDQGWANCSSEESFAEKYKHQRVAKPVCSVNTNR